MSKSAQGSPPRMRGKAIGTGGHNRPPGITPAYAGKRCERQGRVSTGRDHPRVCGEKCRPGDTTNSIKGSPPRMRGKVSERLMAARYARITPAYAGKRKIACVPSLHAKDHPRVCGEKLIALVASPAPRGSPPRMRGKETIRRRKTTCRRITPAYAGKSFQIFPAALPLGDHPRVCGEKCSDRWSFAHVAGSPPRMRGKD